MIITSPDLLITTEEDYSYMYSLFQDTMKEASPPPPPPPQENMNNKRKRKDESEEEELVKVSNNNENKKKQKKVKLKELLTSFLLLDEQEKSDQQELDKISQQESSFLESNHKKKKQTMLDYYSDLQTYYSDIDESDRFLVQQSRLSVNKIATQIASNPKSTNESTTKPVVSNHQRRLWVKDRSKAWWDQCNSPNFPESEFRKSFRMSRATFDMICQELNLAVTKQNTMLRDAIPVPQRVAVCIWRLATGDPLRLVSKRFGLGISTCHKLVLEVCSAIKTVLMPKFLQWPNEEKLRTIGEEFESISRIPNVIGSMYTTHIPIIAPKISVSAYFNKKHTERNQKTSYSITVQGVVDKRGVFTDVCIGWPGSMPDDQVLEKSALYKRANGGELNGVWIVGSRGYPLMDWVLVPYTQTNLTWTQHAFNEKILEIQNVAKDSFTRLKRRWGCLQRRTEMKLQDLPVVLGACCVLHNICEIMNEEMDPELDFELNDDEMVPENSLRSMNSMKARDNIAHNLLHHGLAGTSFV